MNGIINIYKEKGYTSHDVVAKMRGILKIKRIGHTGTLDPDAEGVLPICIGKGTRLVDLIVEKEKTYLAVLKLGIVTDTQDMTGQVLETSEVKVGISEITSAIQSFIGEYDQLPPMYSAIKVNGKRLYELARQGLVIDRKLRKVLIRDIQIQDYNEEAQEVKVLVECGKGTYIRTLLHDIGALLGCGGTMKSLIRTSVGRFHLTEALRLSEVAELVQENRLQEHIIPVDRMFDDYPKLTVAKEYDRLVHNGNALLKSHLEDNDYILSETPCVTSDEPEKRDFFRVYDSEQVFVGIYGYDCEKGCLQVVKMFL